MRLVTVVALAAAVAVWAPSAAARDRPEPVTRWIEIELAEIASHRTNPPRAARVSRS